MEPLFATSSITATIPPFNTQTTISYDYNNNSKLTSATPSTAFAQSSQQQQLLPSVVKHESLLSPVTSPRELIKREVQVFEIGSIPCVGGVLNSLTSHDICVRNAVHLNFNRTVEVAEGTGAVERAAELEGEGEQNYDAVLLFYQVVENGDTGRDLSTSVMKFKGAKVILICMHHSNELIEKKSEEVVVENTKQHVHKLIDMVHKDTQLYECDQNISAINDVVQILIM